MEETLKEKGHPPSPSPSPSLDLQLSISVPSNDCVLIRKENDVEALQCQTAEQTRLAVMEKAYAERVRELTRKEMEIAQSEFTRARSVWARAKEDVERVEKLKERAMDPAFMEITCPSCRQRFKPN